MGSVEVEAHDVVANTWCPASPLSRLEGCLGERTCRGEMESSLV